MSNAVMSDSTRVRHYKFLEGALLELGDRTLEEALEITRKHDEGGGGELFVGFCRDDSDFVELGSVGTGKYLINSDRLGGPEGWWGKLFGLVRFHFSFEGQSKAEHIIRIYYQGTRAEFESLLFRMKEAPVRIDDVKPRLRRRNMRV